MERKSASVQQAAGSCFTISVLVQCGFNNEPRAGHTGDQTPSLANETEAEREAYAALYRNDVPAMVRAFDPDIEWIEPPEYPSGGTYKGHAVVTAHLSQARETWAEGGCEPERFIVAGDKVIVFLQVRARLKHETEWREARLADVYTFRNGKVLQVRSFPDRRQALEWAGANAADAD